MSTTVRDWATVRHFTPAEWLYDPDRVEWDVVLLLDEQRDAHALTLPGVRYVVHCAWEAGGHDAADSSHYGALATAVDYHAEVAGVPVPLLDLWLHAERFPWSGVGLYPHWYSPGLHCDLRRLGRDHPSLGKRWWRDVPTPEGKPNYKSLDRELLRLLLAREEVMP